MSLKKIQIRNTCIYCIFSQKVSANIIILLNIQVIVILKIKNSEHRMMSVKISSFISNITIYYSTFRHYNGVFIRSLSNTRDTDTTLLTAISKIQNFKKMHALENLGLRLSFFLSNISDVGVELIPTGINFKPFL